MRYISANNADSVWQQAIYHLLNNPDYVHKGRNGITFEIIPCIPLEIKEPYQRGILSRNPSFNAAYALVEFIYVPSGNNESKVVNFAVVGSDAARRQSYLDLAYDLVNSCIDQNLKSVSTSWLDFQGALHECE